MPNGRLSVRFELRDGGLTWAVLHVGSEEGGVDVAEMRTDGQLSEDECMKRLLLAWLKEEQRALVLVLRGRRGLAGDQGPANEGTSE